MVPVGWVGGRPCVASLGLGWVWVYSFLEGSTPRGADCVSESELCTLPQPCLRRGGGFPNHGGGLGSRSLLLALDECCELVIPGPRSGPLAVAGTYAKLRMKCFSECRGCVP
jgi:hypothetical protein